MEELARGADVDSSFHSKSLRLIEIEWIVAFGEERMERLDELFMDMVFLIQCNFTDNLELLFLSHLQRGQVLDFFETPSIGQT